MGEGEKYNFYVQSDIKEKVLIINITPVQETRIPETLLIRLVYISCERIIATE